MQSPGPTIRSDFGHGRHMHRALAPAFWPSRPLTEIPSTRSNRGTRRQSPEDSPNSVRSMMSVASWPWCLSRTRLFGLKEVMGMQVDLMDDAVVEAKEVET